MPLTQKRTQKSHMVNMTNTVTVRTRKGKCDSLTYSNYKAAGKSCGKRSLSWNKWLRGTNGDKIIEDHCYNKFFSSRIMDPQDIGKFPNMVFAVKNGK